MKRSLLFLLLLTSALATVQDSTAQKNDTTELLRSKNGQVILPEQDDWAIGFDATSAMEYMGRLFTGDNDAPTADFTGTSQAVAGKYFRRADQAIRAKARVGFSSMTEKALYDTSASGNWQNPLEDRKVTSTTDLYLSIGLEQRKGDTRIQGLYGAEATLGYSDSKVRYDYVEPLSQDHTQHTTNFGQQQGMLIDDPAGTFQLGVRGFVGVEVFVFPKLSVGAEYGWGIAYQYTGRGDAVVETWNSADQITETTTTPTGGNSSFIIDTDNNGGSLMILYHF